MGLKGKKSKEEEAPYEKPLAGAQDVEISGGQPAPEEGSKAALLKSAKPPAAPVGQNQPETAATTTEPSLSWDPSKRSEEEVQRGEDIANKVRSLAKEGNLTADLLKKARDRGVTDSAFDDKSFDAFLEKEGISPSGTLEAGSPLAASPLAASNLRRQDFASQGAFDAAVARQSGGGDAQPAQPLGSGSALRQAPREIGTRAGRLASAARRARRLGMENVAQKFMSDSLGERVKQPSIMTEAQRGRIAGQQKQLEGLLGQRMDYAKKTMDLQNRLLDKRLKNLQTGGLQTGGLQTGGLQTGGLQTGGLNTGGLQTNRLQTNRPDYTMLKRVPSDTKERT